MATYNGARFIRDQLASLAAQTSLPYELIISDDGSVDSTIDVVDEFTKTAPFPVLVIRNARRLGYGQNFLNAARSATGKYIAFCDQDDVWCPDKLAIAADSLESNKAEMFVHSAHLIDDNGERVGHFPQGITKLTVLGPLQLGPWSVFLGCTVVFATQLFELIDSAARGAHTFEYSGLLSHDLWIYFLATSIGTTVTDPRPLIAYRQHGGNVTPSVLKDGIRSHLRALGLPATVNLRRDHIARDRSDLLHALSGSTNRPDLGAAAKRAAEYWLRISRFEYDRIQMYSARPAPQRASACIRLAMSGAYRDYANGGLGWRLLLKDLLVGIFPFRRTAA